MFNRFLLASAASFLLLSACGGDNVKPDDGAMDTEISGGAEQGNSQSGAANGAGDLGQFGYGSGNGISGTDGQSSIDSEFAGLNDPSSPLYTRVIYFDYNDTGIPAEYQQALAAHAQLLSNNPEVRFRLEGHTDERGSREYNIGLGNRRAIAVQQFLQSLGVSDRQVETVSYGEEKPARLEHNEAAWKLNRRVEVVYIGY